MWFFIKSSIVILPLRIVFTKKKISYTPNQKWKCDEQENSKYEIKMYRKSNSTANVETSILQLMSILFFAFNIPKLMWWVARFLCCIHLFRWNFALLQLFLWVYVVVAVVNFFTQPHRIFSRFLCAKNLTIMAKQ